MPKAAVSVALSHALATDGAFHALESRVRRPANSCSSVPRWFRHPFDGGHGKLPGGGHETARWRT